MVSPVSCSRRLSPDSLTLSLQGGGLSVRQQAALESELLRLIASDPVRVRPARIEPRAKKTPAQNYQLLTKPRHKMVLTQRRNRHKAPLT